MKLREATLGVALLCASASAIVTPQASADDLVPVMSGYDWSGSYFGYKLGYGFGKGKIVNRTLGVGTGKFGIGGFAGGLMSGYNFHSGNLVFGLDSDVSVSTIDRRTTRGCNPHCKLDIDTLSTTRLRAGIAMDRFLPYITGGLATGLVDGSSNAFSFKHRFHFGYAAGGGIEYAIADGWSARAEALWVDLGSRSHRAGNTSNRVRVDDMVLIRGGFSMKTSLFLNALFGR